jgi:hypothetical protein
LNNGELWCGFVNIYQAFTKATREEFESIVNGANVEVIEVKKRLWRSVIRQIIGGTKLLGI